jgi:hypothetical protein
MRARPARSKSSALSGHPTSTIEAAVACGFDAIAQIMDQHGENAPTRLSIKSHLQKYRLCTCRHRAQDGRSKSIPRARLRRRPNKVPCGGLAPRKCCTRHRPRAHQRAYHSKGWRAAVDEAEQAAAEVAAEAAAEVAAEAAAEVATVALPPRAFPSRVAARAGTSARASTSSSSRLLGGAGLGGWDGLSSLEHLSH